MKQNAVRCPGCFQSVDGISFLIGFGVSSADHHHTSGCTRIDDKRSGVEVTFGHPFQQFYQVALYAQHDTFGFGITHTDIVFDYHRFAFHVDQPQEDESFIGDTFCL